MAAELWNMHGSVCTAAEEIKKESGNVWGIAQHRLGYTGFVPQIGGAVSQCGVQAGSCHLSSCPSSHLNNVASMTDPGREFNHFSKFHILFIHIPKFKRFFLSQVHIAFYSTIFTWLGKI
ncbi:MAG: hypothetical protein CL912_27715 [Deltaproteobacteria bacterium]|nr:hypothetical protein [Deltaproteobacteria bacterium]